MGEPTKRYQLTSRQMEVVSLVAQGLDNRQIAQRLGIAPGTVRNTLSVIYDAVGVSSRAYLATLLAGGRLGNGHVAAVKTVVPSTQAASMGDVRPDGESTRSKRIRRQPRVN